LGRFGAQECAMSNSNPPLLDRDGTEAKDDGILLTRTGLAKKLNVSLRSIDHLQGRGMPCLLIGRTRRFVLNEVLAWLRRKGGAA